MRATVSIYVPIKISTPLPTHPPHTVTLTHPLTHHLHTAVTHTHTHTHTHPAPQHGAFDAVGTIPGKPDQSESVRSSRLPVRQRLRELTAPALRRITASVNALYPEWCGSSSSRDSDGSSDSDSGESEATGGRGGCTPCFSLVRRYDENSRLEHPSHFDLQALVTVVVSLTSFGRDFDGGIYVTTGGGHNATSFIALQAGDALVHQSDLLHGVHVTPRRDGQGTRWSWILWYKDGPADCSAEPSRWYRKAAEGKNGNPIAQFLFAQRIHMVGSASALKKHPRVVARERLRWLLRSARGGFARAANEVGQCYKDGAGAPASNALAREWFERASATEPEAVYNLGLLDLAESDATESGVDDAIARFAAAAAAGCRDAAHNLGVAHYRGFGSLEVNLSVARQWFVYAGDADSLRIVAKIDKDNEAMQHHSEL
jgi:hypothetical protein